MVRELMYCDEGLYKTAQDPSLEQFINTIKTLKGNHNLVLKVSSKEAYFQIQRCKRERYWVRCSNFDDQSQSRHAILVDLAYPDKLISVPFFDVDSYKDYVLMCDTVTLETALKAAIHYFEHETVDSD